MTTNAKAIESLTEQAARLLGDYVQSGRTRADFLKACAAVIVDLRSHFKLEDGRTDWGGRSPAYRRAVHEIYLAAHVPTDRFDTVQAALRYHVGNLLRDRVPEDELAAVGLSGVSPKARLARNREVVSALSKSGSVGELTGDPVRLLIYAEALLDHVGEDVLSGLPSAQKAAARLALEGLETRIAALMPYVVRKRATRGRAV